MEKCGFGRNTCYKSWQGQNLVFPWRAEILAMNERHEWKHKSCGHHQTTTTKSLHHLQKCPPPPPPPEPRGVNSKGEAGDLRNLSHCHKGLSLVWPQRQRRCQCWRFLVFNRACSVWSRDKDWRSTLVCGPSQWRCKSVDVRRSSYSRRQWLTVQDIDSELFSPAAVGDSSRVLMW